MWFGKDVHVTLRCSKDTYSKYIILKKRWSVISGITERNMSSKIPRGEQQDYLANL